MLLALPAVAFGIGRLGADVVFRRAVVSYIFGARPPVRGVADERRRLLAMPLVVSGAYSGFPDAASTLFRCWTAAFWWRGLRFRVSFFLLVRGRFGSAHGFRPPCMYVGMYNFVVSSWATPLLPPAAFLDDTWRFHESSHFRFYWQAFFVNSWIVLGC